jgi:hypothetical protein
MDSNLLQTLDPSIFLNNPYLLEISFNGNKINALSSKMFQSFYNTPLVLNLGNNTCINQLFNGLQDATKQKALETALSTCDRTYMANNVENLSQLLKDLANLLNNFFASMGSPVLNVNSLLTSYAGKVTNFTKYL